METIRTLKLTNGKEIRDAEIVKLASGEPALHDSSDTFFDGLTELYDATDSSVADAVRDNGWEVCEVVRLVCRDGRVADCAAVKAGDGYEVQYPEGLNNSVWVADLSDATLNAAFAPDWSVEV